MISALPKMQRNSYAFARSFRSLAHNGGHGMFNTSSRAPDHIDIVLPLVVPVRGMRGAKSVVLHRDVIEQQQQRAQAESDAAQQAAPRTQLEDMPVEGLVNPYSKPPPKCILCDHSVELDYKNTRLLSQFVSPHTGQIYGRAVTGLCLFMQRRVATLIKRSQYFGFMPYELKDPCFIRDPKLFDPFKRK